MNELMTLDQVTEWLQMPKSTVYKLVREGKIPARKIGKHWRCVKAELDIWMDERVDEK